MDEKPLQKGEQSKSLSSIKVGSVNVDAANCTVRVVHSVIQSHCYSHKLVPVDAGAEKQHNDCIASGIHSACEAP